MTEFVFAALLRTTLLLTTSAVIVRGIVWAFPLRRPSFHQVAWECVLLQGWFVTQWSWEIPWYGPESPTSVSVAEGLPDFAAIYGARSATVERQHLAVGPSAQMLEQRPTLAS